MTEQTNTEPTAPTVWVAVGEYADDYNGEPPIVVTAWTEHGVKLALAAEVDEFLTANITTEEDPHSDEQNLRDFRAEKGLAADADDVAAWLDAFRLDYDLPVFFTFEQSTPTA